MKDDVLHDHVMNKFLEAAHDSQKWFNRPDWVTAFSIFLDRNPHVLENWPDDE